MGFICFHVKNYGIIYAGNHWKTVTSIALGLATKERFLSLSLSLALLLAVCNKWVLNQFGLGVNLQMYFHNNTKLYNTQDKDTALWSWSLSSPFPPFPPRDLLLRILIMQTIIIETKKWNISKYLV